MIVQYIPGPVHSSKILSIGEELGTLNISTSLSTPIHNVAIQQVGNINRYYLQSTTAPTSRLRFTIGSIPTLNRKLTGLSTTAKVTTPVRELTLPLNVASTMTARPGIYKGSFVVSVYGE
jgi:hypothetical protein